MKLSEAIRLGSRIRPQVFNSFAGWIGKSDAEGRIQIGTCAFGAAAEAIGIPIYDILGKSKVMPALLRAAFPEYDRFAADIVRLNDANHWSREAIADWVDQKSVEWEIWCAGSIHDGKDSRNVDS